MVKPWIFGEIKEQRDWDITSTERFEILRRFVNYGLEHWGSDTKGNLFFKFREWARSQPTAYYLVIKPVGNLGSEFLSFKQAMTKCKKNFKIFFGFLGVELTRRFLLDWLSFLCRYIPVGLLEQPPQKINDRSPKYIGRDDMETLLGSQNPSDWVKIR